MDLSTAHCGASWPPARRVGDRRTTPTGSPAIDIVVGVVEDQA